MKEQRRKSLVAAMGFTTLTGKEPVFATITQLVTLTGRSDIEK